MLVLKLLGGTGSLPRMCRPLGEAKDDLRLEQFPLAHLDGALHLGAKLWQQALDVNAQEPPYDEPYSRRA